MSDFEPVAKLSEIPAGGRKSLVFDDRVVLLVRMGDEFFAVEDVCSHDGQPLTEGPLVGNSVECPRHGARFDLRTGRPLCMPAVEPIATYEVLVRGDDVLLRKPSE
jgi:3-phenylpropionate/trans-cinnamate dioxygenase ferredoxin component